MIQLLFILAARNDDDGWIKFFFGALIFMFWIISALAKAISKKQEKERRERVRQQLEHPQMTSAPKTEKRPVELSPQVAMRVPPPAKPRAPARATPKQRRTSKKPAASAPGFTPPSVAQPIAVAAPAPTIIKPQPAIAPAMSIRRWLTPATLRQQFVLTEILQPPKALREPEA